MVEVSPAFRRRLHNVMPQIAEKIRPVLVQSADELVAMMKQLCPVEDGDLRDSIGWAWGDAPRGAILIDKLSGRSLGKDRIVIYAGNAKAYYAAWVEFGTAPHSLVLNASVKRAASGSRLNERRQRQGLESGKYHPGATAHPFFFPAYRALKRRIRNRITRATRKALREIGSG